ILNLLCSRIELRSGNLGEAERCLQRKIDILESLPVIIHDFYSHSLLQMARVHLLSGRPDSAREEFRKAIEVIEENDDYFANAQTRMSFENERRDLYDSAIAFEYDHDRPDAAWGYTQRYRAKLFLEFMGQINPAVAEVHSEEMQRGKVQKLIPNGVQVIEYVLLQDRLLIWLVSGKTFASRSIPISRAALDKKVNDFLAGIRKEEDVTGRSRELHRLLIAPVEDL